MGIIYYKILYFDFYILGADYRYSTILLYNNLKDYCTEDIKNILQTLVEISYHCYQNVQKRSPRNILRLHNITFKHALLCINALSTQKVISKQKLFGIYFHSLTTHLPQMARVFAPSQLHTEDEERLFSHIKSNKSSNIVQESRIGS